MIDTILSNSPLIALPQSTEDISTRNWTVPSDTATASQTKVTLSRRRRGTILTNPTRPLTLPISTEPQCLPTVEIRDKKCKQFWDMICDEKGSALSFDELVAFMDNAGYKMTKIGGAGRRFVLKASDGSHLDTIVFHQFHGRGESKIPLRVARAEWGDRIKEHVNVILV